MAEEIDVSFVMTVYNKEFYLPSVITALLGQTGLKNPEFIFVDDVSSDNSVEIIRRMTEGVKNVTIVTNPYNRGISARINQGIALAKGKWTRMLDSDDIFSLGLHGENAGGGRGNRRRDDLRLFYQNRQRSEGTGKLPAGRV